MTIICKHLDFLPEIPDDLTTQFKGDFEAVRDVWYPMGRISFSHFAKLDHCKEIKNWLEENITKCELHHIKHIQARGNPDSGFVGYHSDGPNRRWALNYVLETGNPVEPVTTSFWRDTKLYAESGSILAGHTKNDMEAGRWWKGVSSEQKQKPALKGEEYLKRGNVDDLELLLKVDKEPCKWYLFNGHVIHSVENIKTVRNMISISFGEDFDMYQIPWWKDVAQ